VSSTDGLQATSEYIGTNVFYLPLIIFYIYQFGSV
jgi:hypothetical protein